MDHRSGHTPHAASDRLAALRSPASSDDDASRQSHSRVRIDVLLGVLLILVGVAVVLYFRGNTPAEPVTDGAVVTNPSIQPPTQSLMAGEALVAVALDDGAFPPDIRPGDVVRVIVSPNADGEGIVRSLGERVVVHRVATANAGMSSHVITLRAPETVAVDMAGSGPVHLAIVEVAP